MNEKFFNTDTLLNKYIPYKDLKAETQSDIYQYYKHNHMLITPMDEALILNDAIINGYIDLAQVFIKKGFYIYDTFKILKLSSFETIKTIFEFEPSLFNNDFDTPLSYAVLLGDLQLFKFFHSNGYSVIEKDYLALTRVAFVDNDDILAYILNSSPYILNDSPALHHLLSKIVSVNHSSYKCFDLLTNIVDNDFQEILVEFSKNTLINTFRNALPYHFATTSNSEIFLLDRLLTLCSTNKIYITTITDIYQTVAFSNNKNLKQIFSKYINDFLDENGNTILMQTLNNLDYSKEHIKILIAMGADPKKTNYHGNNFLSLLQTMNI